MNYSKHYNLLIKKARNRVLNCYSEIHHVVPKCLGGTDDESNLIRLTSEEHFVAHQLLMKMYPGNRKLIHAAILMNASSDGQKRNNKQYGWLRRKLSDNMKGNKLRFGAVVSQTFKENMKGHERTAKSYQVYKNGLLFQSIKNLSKFCRNQGLNRNTLAGTINHKPTSEGWFVVKI